MNYFQVLFHRHGYRIRLFVSRRWLILGMFPVRESFKCYSLTHKSHLHILRSRLCFLLHFQLLQFYRIGYLLKLPGLFLIYTQSKAILQEYLQNHLSWAIHTFLLIKEELLKLFLHIQIFDQYYDINKNKNHNQGIFPKIYLLVNLI